MAKKRDKHTGELFIEESGQLRLLDKSAEQQAIEGGEVTCLGKTFPNDDARREYFLERLREKLQDPEFRKTPGFPNGTDEAILELSDPPFFTACPNPFVEPVARSWTTQSQRRSRIHRPPFADDIVTGKGDRSYYIHGYHTKVPPSAVSQLLRHYTNPGDVVMDCFCGSGMTAVGSAILPEANLGVILSDLSTAATFISYFHSLFRPSPRDRQLVAETFRQARAKYRDFYQTRHTGWLAASEAPENYTDAVTSTAREHGDIVYVVWSEVIRCPECGEEESLWSASVDLPRNSVSADFSCRRCDALITKTIKGAKKRGSIVAESAMEVVHDRALRANVQRVKRMPALISYNFKGRRYEKAPDSEDLARIAKAEELKIDEWYPADAIPTGDKTGDPLRAGISHVHHYYPSRTLAVLAFLSDRLRSRPGMIGFLTSILTRCSWQNRYMPQHRGNRSREVVGPLSGTLYIPPFALEINPVEYGETKSRNILTRLARIPAARAVISTEAAASVGQKVAGIVDYAFIDPPFGFNLQYSELSFAIESWLRVCTGNEHEAVVNDSQRKTVEHYGQLMRAGFRSVFESLKPGHWTTIEFSNSSNAIWNVIQTAAGEAGLVVADVRILDKKKGTTKQLTQANTVKQDLIISAYRPTEELVERFKLSAATQESAWAFVDEHLHNLPIFIERNGEAEVVVERTRQMLLDRTIAFHVQRGVAVPISGPEFFAGLDQRYPEREGMYFRSDQVTEFDRNRTTIGTLRQLSLFVNDEASAIRWVRQQLHDKPQTFQDLQPQLMRELQPWAKHEQTIELRVILEQNFLCYRGTGPVPGQIHSYLSTNFKDLRNLDKEAPTLVAKAENRWYVPNTSKQDDLEKTREKQLLREFEDYRTTTKRKLKLFRTEAVRTGFKAAYDRQEYRTIIDVAHKLPETVLQEDEKLLMYYDVALTRLGED